MKLRDDRGKVKLSHLLGISRVNGGGNTISEDNGKALFINCRTKLDQQNKITTSARLGREWDLEIRVNRMNPEYDLWSFVGTVTNQGGVYEYCL